MGSFAFTCAVSGLPIEWQDDVRYGLVTANPYQERLSFNSSMFWFPRVWPIRAKYNDYGSVEGPELAAAATATAWFDGFGIDLVERKQGENPYHDVPTSKGMTWEALLPALWENRVLVERRVPDFSVLHRWPPPPRQALSEDDPGHLPVRQFMIRQDVWDGLLKLSLDNLLQPPLAWGPEASTSFTLEAFRSRVRAHWDQIPIRLERNAELGRLSGDELTNRYQALMEETEKEKMDLATHLVAHNEVPGALGLATTYKLVARRYREGLINQSEVDAFLSTVAEFSFIHWILSMVRHTWRPSFVGGPQFGEWNLHGQVLDVFRGVTSEIEKKQAEEE